MSEEEKYKKAINELADSYELHLKQWAKRCIDTINEYTTNLQQELQQKENIIKEVREKVDNFDVFKEFTFPLMKKWEEQEVKSSIDYEWNQSIKKPILQILDKEVN